MPEKAVLLPQRPRVASMIAKVGNLLVSLDGIKEQLSEEGTEERP